MATDFREDHSDFYDIEYFIAMEYRYLSGAHQNRVDEILAQVGDVSGKRVLDLGAGHGFFANALSEKGADVVGLDYSAAAVQFAKERYPGVDMRRGSAYDLTSFEESSFDVVLLLDIIEHLRDQSRVLLNVQRVLKPKGKLVLSTDVDGNLWSNGRFAGLVNLSHRISSAGRAYLLIKKVEAQRRTIKNYHQSHVGLLSIDDTLGLLANHGFKLVDHRVFPVVGVPLRDLVFRLLPRRQRGDHQALSLSNEKKPSL